MTGEAFDCGEEALNEFLRRHARKSHELDGAQTFLAIDNTGNKTILGFYSLSPASVDTRARHDVPMFRLARLAVDRRVQGQRLGGQLLLAAGRRCLRASAEVGGVGLLIDAKNERVTSWYANYDTVPLWCSTPMSLSPLA